MRQTIISFAVAISASATLLAPALGARAASLTSVPEADVCEAILETVEQDVAGDVPDDLSTFADIIASAPENAIQSAESPVTLFIPANLAFDEIPANVLDSIVADEVLLASILAYHLIPGAALSAADLAAQGSAESAQGALLSFELDGDTLAINGGAATVLCSDIASDGDMIHIIDRVLQPPSDGIGAPGSSVPAFTEEQEAVASAFETAVDSSLTYDQQAPFIENAEALRETIENYPRAAEVVMGISADVTSVAIDGGTAAITYVLSFNGVDAGYGDLDATMALLDGAWVVPHDEYCAFQSQARNNCPD